MMVIKDVLSCIMAVRADNTGTEHLSNIGDWGVYMTRIG